MYRDRRLTVTFRCSSGPRSDKWACGATCSGRTCTCATRAWFRPSRTTSTSPRSTTTSRTASRTRRCAPVLSAPSCLLPLWLVSCESSRVESSRLGLGKPWANLMLSISLWTIARARCAHVDPAPYSWCRPPRARLCSSFSRTNTSRASPISRSTTLSGTNTSILLLAFVSALLLCLCNYLSYKSEWLMSSFILQVLYYTHLGHCTLRLFLLEITVTITAVLNILIQVFVWVSCTRYLSNLPRADMSIYQYILISCYFASICAKYCTDTSICANRSLHFW